MLIEWKLHNFKSIKELPDDFRLAPVTVLAGANSSGKTALLQSILLVAQTLSSPVTTRALVLNGEAVKLGAWSDVPHCDFKDEPVAFGCSIDLPPKPLGYDVGAELWARQPSVLRRHMIEGVTKVTFSASFCTPDQRVDTMLEPTIDKVEIGMQRSVTRGRGKQVPPVSSSIAVRHRKHALSVKKLNELRPLLPEDMDRSVLDYIVSQTTPQVPFEPWEDGEYFREQLVRATTIGTIFRHFLPDTLVQKYDTAARQLGQVMRDVLAFSPTADMRRRATSKLTELIRDDMFRGSEQISKDLVNCVNNFLRDFDITLQFRGSTSAELAKFLGEVSRKRLFHQRRLAQTVADLLSYELNDFVVEDSRRFAVEPTPVPEFARIATTVLREFFSTQIKYLGPLRDDPRVFYALPPTPDILDVGIKGQYTAVVLDRNKNRRVRFIDPVTEREKRSSLQDAVVAWLQHMDMLESVSTNEAGKLGYELSVWASGLDRKLDLTTVGVGASQVLPILVMALLAVPGTLLIFEQPEIHLHPRVQSLLGDFFLSMGQLGKQCLIETHSEYLVNRLRFRIAKAEDDAILNLVKIYFAERKGNASHFREVKPNQYGAILEWPAGFFDEGVLQAESIIRSGIEKRKSRPRQRSNECSN